MAGRVIMRTAYGIDVQDSNDPYIDIAERALQAVNAGVNAGSFLVDIVPICESLRDGLLVHRSHVFFVVRHIPDWFPGANFKRLAKKWRVPVTEMSEKPYAYFKKRMVRSRLSRYLNSQSVCLLERRQRYSTLRSVFFA